MSSILNIEALAAQTQNLAKSFRSAAPYPHLVLEQFLDESTAARAERDFPKPDSAEWLHYKHFNEKKLAHSSLELMPPTLRSIIEELNSPRFCAWLSAISGIPGLVPDPELAGGGLHQMARGGFLNVHTDFSSHPRHDHWVRRVNVLIYLNSDWNEAWNGHLELWDNEMRACQQRIAPLFNRCVIFRTDQISYHGVPVRLECPEDRARRSIALYYFTVESDRPAARATHYRPTPKDGFLRRCGVYLDGLALRVYDRLRRKLGMSDKLVSSILRRLGK